MDELGWTGENLNCSSVLSCKTSLVVTAAKVDQLSRMLVWAVTSRTPWKEEP
jgi:hypothetical protein